MPQIKRNQDFANGDLVTATTLKNIIDLAELNPEAITDQDPLATSFDIQSNDLLLLWDYSESDPNKKLKKVTIDDIFRSGQTVKFSSISGISGSDLTVSIAGGQSFVVNGNTSISGNLVGSGLIQGYTGKFTSELTIPSGDTASRPASPIAGNTRYNTTIGAIETYNGTSWVSGSILPNNNTFTGKNTFSNEIDINGTVKFDDTPPFALYDVFKKTATGATITNTATYTLLPPFTKPVGEIWIFEMSITGASPDLTFSPSGTAFGGGKAIYKVILGVTDSVISQSLVCVNNIGYSIAIGNWELLIFKYKTADSKMVKSKAYINNGTSVTVTSTAHGLSAGQYITVYATNQEINGRYQITSAATDTFVFANTATAGSGTLCYIA